MWGAWFVFLVYLFHRNVGILKGNMSKWTFNPDIRLFLNLNSPVFEIFFMTRVFLLLNILSLILEKKEIPFSFLYNGTISLKKNYVKISVLVDFLKRVTKELLVRQSVGWNSIYITENSKRHSIYFKSQHICLIFIFHSLSSINGLKCVVEDFSSIRDHLRTALKICYLFSFWIFLSVKNAYH